MEGPLPSLHLTIWEIFWGCTSPIVYMSKIQNFKSSDKEMKFLPLHFTEVSLLVCPVTLLVIVCPNYRFPWHSARQFWSFSFVRSVVPGVFMRVSLCFCNCCLFVSLNTVLPPSKYCFLGERKVVLIFWVFLSSGSYIPVNIPSLLRKLKEKNSNISTFGSWKRGCWYVKAKCTLNCRSLFFSLAPQLNLLNEIFIVLIFFLLAVVRFVYINSGRDRHRSWTCSLKL